MLTVGRSMGGTERGGPDDTFGRVGFLAGWSSDRLAGQVRVGVEGRRDDAAPSGFRHAQDVLAEGNATLYWLPRDGLVQSVVLRASVQGGWQTTAPFQLTLGGPEGLRGYDEDDFPGGRRSLVSAELRLARPASPFPRLFDAGLTLFGEVGAMGRGDAPYGVDSGWHGSLGAGLRLGFPAGTS